MNELDFSGIDPLRVPEARRRVTAISDYLKLPAPTSEHTQSFAASIGLSRNQFCRLARVWRDYREPALLVIGKRGASTRDYGVDERAIEIANEIITFAGASAKLTKVTTEVGERCAVEGVVPPARATINNYIRKALASASNVGAGPPRVVVGRMWFHLPVSGVPTNSMPTMLAAIMLPERMIVAHSISTDPMTPPLVSNLIDNVAALSTDAKPSRPLLLDPDDRRVAAEALTRAGLGKTRSHNRSVQRELSHAFGGRLGELTAIYQRTMARPATKRVITRQDQALNALEVVEIIEGAVQAHNAELGVRPEFALAPV